MVDHDVTTMPAAGGQDDTDNTLAYPISPDYVKSWTPVRALCELIANALDEDPAARVSWADGVLTIADDGPGIPEEGLVLGHSTKTADQIGQFGEGKKLAALVLARSPEVGQVHCETVGYGFTPSVERRHLLGGLVPSRSAQGAELLVYHLYRTGRSKGTVFTVECSRELADEAIGRFRALAEPGYQPPAAPGQCVLDGTPGRVWIGGVLVTVMPGLLASYDLPLDAKGLQNRDRTVIEAAPCAPPCVPCSPSARTGRSSSDSRGMRWPGGSYRSRSSSSATSTRPTPGRPGAGGLAPICPPRPTTPPAATRKRRWT